MFGEIDVIYDLICQNTTSSKVQFTSLKERWGILRRSAFPSVRGGGVMAVTLLIDETSMLTMTLCPGSCLSLWLKIEIYTHSESTSYTAFSITCLFGFICCCCCCLLVSNSDRRGRRQRETGRGIDVELRWHCNFTLAGTVFRTDLSCSSTTVIKINIFL